MGNYNCTKDVYEADMVKAIMKPKADMLLKKYGHGLRSAKGQIYSIGVCVENATKDCEKYSILHDKSGRVFLI